MSRWPNDNQNELIKFYGNPGSSGTNGVSSQLVHVTPPFQMYYDKRPIKTLMFHKKAASALMAALNEIAAAHPQAELDRLGVSSTGGTFNPRKVRGSATKWSNHAFGAAIDMDPDHNGFNTGHGAMPAFVVAAFDRQGFRWGGRYQHRTDPMHFEACNPGAVFTAQVASFADLPPVDADQEHENGVTFHEDDQAPEATDDSQDTDTPDVVAHAAKIVTARTAAASGAAILTGGEVASSIVGPASEMADQFTSVVDKSGSVIDATKQLVAVPKPGFWFGLLHVVTNPIFVLAMLGLIVAAWGLVWFWQRQHRQGIVQ